MANSYLKYTLDGETYIYEFTASPSDISWEYSLNTTSYETWGGVVTQILSCSVGNLTMSGVLPPLVTSSTDGDGNITYSREGRFAEMDRFVKWIVGAMDYQEKRGAKGRKILLHIELSDMFRGSTHLKDYRSLDFDVYLNSYPRIERALSTGVPEFRLVMSILQGSSALSSMVTGSLKELGSTTLSGISKEAVVTLSEILDVNWVKSKYNSVESYEDSVDLESKTVMESRYQSDAAGDITMSLDYATRETTHVAKLTESPVNVGVGFGFPWYDFKKPSVTEVDGLATDPVATETTSPTKVSWSVRPSIIE